MTRAALILRIVLGLFILMAGINKFYSIMPTPEHTDKGIALLAAMANTRYMLHLVGLVEIACGAMLLSGRFVPLALVMLAPISVNIVLFGVMLDPGGIGPAIMVASLNALLAIFYREKLAPLFT